MGIAQLINARSIKNFGIYLSCSLVFRSVALLITPLMLHRLSPSQIGLLSLANSFITIFSVVLGGGLRQVLWLDFFHGTAQEQQNQIHTIISIYLLYAVPITLGSIFLWCGGGYRIISGESVDLVDVLVAGVEIFLVSFLLFFSDLITQITTYQQNTNHFILLQLANIGGISAGAIVTLMWVPTVSSALSGQLLGCCCMIGLGYCYWNQDHYQENFKIPSLPIIKSFFRRSIFFVPCVVSGWVLASSNRWLLARYVSVEEVAVYSIVELSSTLFYACILQPLSNAYLPLLLQQFSRQTSDIIQLDKNNLQSMTWAMSALSIAGVIAYFVCKPIAYYVLPHYYHRAIPYTLLALAGNIALLGTYFTTALPQFYKKTRFIVGSLAATAILATVSSFLLIPRQGLAGATLSLALAYIFYYCITLWYNQNLHKGVIISQEMK
jgi:O-antigen/teichoic acid export membrane protein